MVFYMRYWRGKSENHNFRQAQTVNRAHGSLGCWHFWIYSFLFFIRPWLFSISSAGFGKKRDQPTWLPSFSLHFPGQFWEYGMVSVSALAPSGIGRWEWNWDITICPHPTLNFLSIPWLAWKQTKHWLTLLPWSCSHQLLWRQCSRIFEIGKRKGNKLIKSIFFLWVFGGLLF